VGPAFKSSQAPVPIAYSNKDAIWIGKVCSAVKNDTEAADAGIH
jgi:hypothetical protein